MKDRYIIRSEKGELLVLFSVVLVILLMITGFSADYILYTNTRDKLAEVAYLIKDTRYDLSELLFHSNNPQKELEEIANRITLANNLDPSSVTVQWEENFYSNSNPDGVFINTGRKAITNISIEDSYQTIFLKMFNIEELPIAINISDELVKETEHGYVWTPGNK